MNVERLSRTPDQRLYPSGSHDGYAWTQCWVSLGDPDGEDFMFTKCDANGNFRFANVPGGNWRLTIGDQWNDVLMFRRSGFSIAMGNASDEVKREATWVTASNEDEGFAKAVEELVLPRASPRPA